MAKCLICRTRAALPYPASVFQLCEPCADDRFPGPDVDAYRALKARYGYDRH